MTWVRLDDSFYDHPKVDPLSQDAFRLWMCSIGYCGRHLTDGFIPGTKVSTLCRVRRLKPVIDELISAHLWEPIEGGYRVHDFLEYNPTREQVLKDRQSAAERKQRQRLRERHESHGVSHAVTDGVTHTSPTRPVPRIESISESPTEEGSGGEQKAAADAAVEGADKGKSRRRGRPKPLVDLADPRIDEVWAHYRARIQPRAKVCPREDIGRRLLTFSVGDLKTAIDHFAKDAFYGASQKHRGASLLFCRSDQKTEEFVNLVPRETLSVSSNGKAKDQAVADAGKRYEYAK